MIAQAVLFACLLQLIVYVSSQFDIPPCTEYFQFLKNDSTNEIFGRFEVSSIEKNAVNVSVKLSFTAEFNTIYSVEVKLNDPLLESIKRIQRGESLKYNIHFPIQQPRPLMNSLWLNNRQRCANPNVVGPNFTHIVLHHVLELPETWLNTNTPLDVSMSRSYVTISAEKTKELQTTCGIRNTALPYRISRIMKGTKTKEGDWPWLVAIFRESNHGMVFKCAGTLISEKHVITVAHCVVDQRPGFYTVALGRSDIKDWRKRGSVNREVQQIIVHPNYDASTTDSNLAIITIASKVEFNSRIRPICLSTGDTRIQDYVGRYGVVVGWGQSEEESSNSGTNTARMVEVPIVSQDECLKTYKHNGKLIVTDRTFCAGNTEIEAGPCIGDGGSAFVMQDVPNSAYYLRGIVSSALSINGRCDLKEYVLYVNVAHYTNWIRQQIASDI